MKRIVFICVLGVIAVGALVAAILNQPQQTPNVLHAHVEPSKAPVITQVTKMETPVRLNIPAINLEAEIVEVGRTPEGDMDAPKSESVLGWYKFGVFPGNPGAAVLGAHTGKPESPSIFRSLNKLTKGNEFTIQDIHGTTASFEVTSQETYPYKQAPLEKIFGTTDTAQLAIITCTGTWSPQTQTYSHRLVVYAKRKQT